MLSLLNHFSFSWRQKTGSSVIWCRETLSTHTGWLLVGCWLLVGLYFLLQEPDLQELDGEAVGGLLLQPDWIGRQGWWWCVSCVDKNLLIIFKSGFTLNNILFIQRYVDLYATIAITKHFVKDLVELRCTLNLNGYALFNTFVGRALGFWVLLKVTIL